MSSSREFQAGRYNPVVPFPEFPITPTSPAPGAGHPTIEAALAACDADGTRSILDIAFVGETPDFLVAAPLAPEVLRSTFGTTQPTVRVVEAQPKILEHVGRGQAVYVIAYEDGAPTAIVFAGISCD